MPSAGPTLTAASLEIRGGMNMQRVAAWLLIGLGLCSCQLESAVRVPTELVVDVDAEPVVRLNATKLRIVVVTGGRPGEPLADVPSVQQEFEPGAPGQSGWPVRL